MRGTGAVRTVVGVKLALVIALLLVPATARAERWTHLDTALEATTLALFAVDYAQTRQILADGREGNMLMDEAGIPPEPYFLAAAALHVVGAAVLPQPYRRIAQGVTIGVQVGAIQANWHAGYSLVW